jgi:hypothetical protein
MEVKNFAALPESPGPEWLTWSSEPSAIAPVSPGRNYGRICPISPAGAPDQGPRAASGRAMNRPFTWGDASSATPRDGRAGAQPPVQCSMCGIVLPTGLMVPDGGQACADIRWYCKDAQACTERWTANPQRRAHLAPNPPTITAPAAPREASPQPGDPRPGERPDPVPAELLGRAPEQTWSIDPP